MADPIGESGCQFWYDATVGVTGTPVDTWADQSGNSRTVTFLTTARPSSGTRTSPTGRNTIDFDGTNDRGTTAAFSLAQPFTVGIVFKSDDGADSTSQCLIDKNVTGAAPRMRKTTSNLWTVDSGVALTSGTADTSWHVWIYVANGVSNSVNEVDGSAVTGNGGTNGITNGLSIASLFSPADFFDGMIGEIVGYNSAFDATKRSTLRTYLNLWITAATFAPPPPNPVRRLLPILVR